MSESDTTTDFGFVWGPMQVERMARVVNGDTETYVLGLYVNGELATEIRVSRTGRSVRVFKGDVELTAAPVAAPVAAPTVVHYPMPELPFPADGLYRPDPYSGSILPPMPFGGGTFTINNNAAELGAQDYAVTS